VFNEINARRINDELNVFEGLHTSPIFLAVIAVTVGLQALIMQTRMGMFFKVLPLNGAEWGISIAIGATATPVSIATRLLGQAMPTVRRRRHGRRTLSAGHGGGSRIHNEAAAAALARRTSMQKERSHLSQPMSPRGHHQAGQRGALDSPRAVPRLATATVPEEGV